MVETSTTFVIKKKAAYRESVTRGIDKSIDFVLKNKYKEELFHAAGWVYGADKPT